MNRARFECGKKERAIKRPEFPKEKNGIWGIHHVGEGLLDVCD